MYSDAFATILEIASVTPKNNLGNVIACLNTVLEEQKKQDELSEKLVASVALSMDDFDGETDV